MLYNKTIIKEQIGDVTGDGVSDIVYLLGVKANDDSPFIKDIELAIRDGKTNEIYRITLKDNAGYNPNIILESFATKMVKDIFVSIESGGSGGFGFYYVYSFYHNKEQLLFDVNNFNDTFKYIVTYQDNYNVKVTNTTLRKASIINISMRDKEYLGNLYDESGHLKKATEGEVLYLNTLYPVDINGDGIYDLYAINRIIGLYGADTLGYIVTPLYWDNESFKLLGDMQYVMVNEDDV